MWSIEQQQRLALEHASLQREGFDQFSIYWYQATSTYKGYGIATSSSGRRYQLEMPIPSGFPYARPPLYLTDPLPLYMADGRAISSLGASHQMHTLSPSASGAIQICHWRDNRWHSGIRLHQVFLKGLIWIEAYEQHLATGQSLADFVVTMKETL